MVLEKLKDFPKDKTLIILTLLTSIPFLALTIVFCVNEVRLMSFLEYGVLDFELAWTSNMVNTIFTSWGTAEMQHQAFITYIDYFFIPCYGLFGFECILIASRKLKGSLLNYGIIISLSPLIAGLFDAFENVNLLLMLNNTAYISTLSPFFASLCASFKIAFLGAGLGFLYISITILIFRRKKIQKSYLYLVLLGGGICFFLLLIIWNPYVSIVIGAVYFAIFCFICYRLNNESP